MPTQMFKFVRLLFLLSITALCCVVGAAANEPAESPTVVLSNRQATQQTIQQTTEQTTEQDYLERATNYRRAGDTRREQLELSNALNIWPDSLQLRYTYALHLVRRKNYPGALLHTTHALALNPDQPVSANLHLQLLGKLQRHADGAKWVRDLLLSNRAEPPLKLWSPQWLERWRPLLKLGQQHATLARDRQTLNLIEHALQGS